MASSCESGSSVFRLALVVLVSASTSAALQGVALVKPGTSKTFTLVSMSSGGAGSADTIYGPAQWGSDWRSGEGTGPCFSPDGKRIAFAKGEWMGPFDSKRTTICTMSNDGTHVDTICFAENPDASGLCMSWTSAGYLYWSEGCNTVYRASLLAKKREIVATLDDFTGPKPSPLRIDNLQMSLDGARGGFMLNGVGYCMSLDFTTKLSRDYGTGCQGTVSPNGLRVTHSYSGLISGYSFHQVGAIQDFETKAVLDTFFAPGATPNGTGALPRIVFIRFSHSSNTHVVFSGEDALDGNGYVHDLTGNETQYIGKCQPYDFWVGTLPSPAGPFVSLDKTSLVFTSADGSAPPSQVVNVTNTGSGSLGTLTATVDPASSAWLTATPSGAAVTTSVNPSSLARGTYFGTVAVTSGSALNAAVFTVMVNVRSTVNAPTNLVPGKVWQPASSIGLSWKDNATNETGFVIERRLDTTAFAVVRTVAANTVRYMDTVPSTGVYTYRVRAITSADSSGWSNEATMRMQFNPSITVLAPAAAATWPGRSTQYIRWRTDGVPNVDIRYSTDQGLTWLLVSQSGSVNNTMPTWGNYPWVVPDLNADSILVQVCAYGNPSLNGQSGYFRIGPPAGVRSQVATSTIRTALRSPAGITFQGSARIVCDLSAGERAELRIYGLDGSLVTAIALEGAPGSRIVAWDGRDLRGNRAAPGLYSVRLVSQP
jgi:hypothetical protein